MTPHKARPAWALPWCVRQRRLVNSDRDKRQRAEACCPYGYNRSHYSRFSRFGSIAHQFPVRIESMLVEARMDETSGGRKASLRVSLLGIVGGSVVLWLIAALILKSL